MEMKDENPQEQWKRKVLDLRLPNPTGKSRDDEYAANQWLAYKLRELADHIAKSDEYPLVFGCSIPEDGVKQKGLMLEYRVILSHPWPG